MPKSPSLRSIIARWSKARTPGRSGDDGQPPTPEEVANGRLLRFEAPFNNLAMGAIPSFYALYAIQLGASNSMIGWLTAGPALLNLLWLLPCGRLVERTADYRRPMVWGHAGQRLALLALACVPFLPAALRPWGIVLLVTLAGMPTTMWGIAFDAAAAEMFSPRHFARFFSHRWAAAYISNIVGVFAIGKLIDVIPFPLNYQTLIAGVALLTLVSIRVVRGFHLSPRVPAESAGGARRSLRDLLRAEKSFFRFEAGMTFAYLAVYAAQPLFRIYWVRGLGASGGWVGGLAAAFAIGAIAGNLFWGRRSRADRDRRTWLIGAVGMIGLYPILTSLATTLPPLLAVCAFAGFFSACNDLMMFKRLVQVLPPGQRATFMALHNLFMNCVAFLGPLASTRLIDRVGMAPVLVGVGLLGIAGAAALYALAWHALAGEPQPAPAV